MKLELWAKDLKKFILANIFSNIWRICLCRNGRMFILINMIQFIAWPLPKSNKND